MRPSEDWARHEMLGRSRFAQGRLAHLLARISISHNVDAVAEIGEIRLSDGWKVILRTVLHAMLDAVQRSRSARPLPRDSVESSSQFPSSGVHARRAHISLESPGKTLQPCATLGVGLREQ